MLAVRSVPGVTLAALVFAACGGESAANGMPVAGMGGGDEIGFEASVQPLVDYACNCHQSTPLMATFSLKPGEAYGNLVGRPAMELPTMLLVSPGKLNESYLWHKVNGTQVEVGGSGDVMPPTFPLEADQLSVLERWIAGGALP